MLDQLRLQDGRLFQSESILALFLDAKAVALEAFTNALRSSERDDALKKLLVDDDSFDTFESSLKALAPSGFEDYHAKALHDCVKTSAALLWPTEIFLVARPKVLTLIKGLFKRLASTDCIRSGEFLSLDPIKQDFVVREAFRRTLVNDCLVVFDAPEQETFEEVHKNDDSYSKSGPRSTLGPIDDDDLDGSASTAGPATSRAEDTFSVAKSDSRSVAKSVALSVSQGLSQGLSDKQKVLDRESVAPSVAPRVVKDDRSHVSKASVATGVSTTSVRTPLNVRKVKIEPEV